jgi:uncharacterized protein YwgA
MKSLIPLIQLFQVLEHVRGRKKLQKMVHLLQECGGADFGLSFSLSHYGAFSAELASTLDTLEEQNLLESKPQTVGGYLTQDYKATKRLIAVLNFVNETERDPKWKELAIELDKKQVRELEAISTIVFLRKSGWSISDVKDQFSKIKSHLLDIYEKSSEEADKIMHAPAN